MSKSLDAYYQETGRAGRDGKDSDCVLLYRGQDASRLTSLIYGDVDGVSKRKPYYTIVGNTDQGDAVQEMLRFAQDLKTCRKVAFAKVNIFAVARLMLTGDSTSPQVVISRPRLGTTPTPLVRLDLDLL